MMKRLVVLLLAVVAISFSGFAQDVKVNIKKGIPYCTSYFPGEDKMQKLFLDFYEPAGKSDTLRPLVITLFGGAYVIGTRDYADMVEWCTRYAQAGYAAASIDYHLMSASKITAVNMIRTGYMAAQDVSAAVRFFKAHWKDYRIDTNRIFLLGQSAGAVSILHAIFLTEDERPQETFLEPALSPLHSQGDKKSCAQTFSVAGAVLLWGSIFDPEMIDADETTPICMIHGGKDWILDADSGCAFSIPILPYVYGSNTIAKRLQELGASSFENHFLEQESHAFYFKHLYLYQIDALKFDICWDIAHDFTERVGKK